LHTARNQILLTNAVQETGAGVRVAVLDTGADLTHPDLRGRVNEDLSRSFTVNEDLLDRNGHGTHITGIIGGSGAATNGVYRGIAPGCELVVLKIAEVGKAKEWNAERAIEYAVDAKVDIINYSHGFSPNGKGTPPWLWPAQLNVLELLFQAADAAGILCVAAAGNEGPNDGSITRPGGLGCVLTVGAVDENSLVFDTSSRGPFRRSSDLRAGAVRRYDNETANITTINKPDIVAPGRIVATRSSLCPPDDGDPDSSDPLYVTMGGTSQATAVVTGMAALCLELLRRNNTSLGPRPAQTLRRLLCRSVGNLEPQTHRDVGEGLILWPSLVATVQDFVTDPAFQTVILAQNSLVPLLVK